MNHLLPVTENPAVLNPRGHLTKVQQNALDAVDFYKRQRRVLGGWEIGGKRFSTATINALIKDGLLRLSGASVQLTQGGQIALLKLKGPAE